MLAAVKLSSKVLTLSLIESPVGDPGIAVSKALSTWVLISDAVGGAAVIYPSIAMILSLRELVAPEVTAVFKAVSTSALISAAVGGAAVM